jgi:putative ABC transport system permease protein
MKLKDKTTKATLSGGKYRAIKLRVLFHIAWKNITHKKLRSFLTVFGVVIGISTVGFLVAFGLGIQELVTKQVIGDQSLKAIDVSSPNSKILQLNDEAVNKISEFSHVERIGLQYSFPGSVTFNGGEVDAVAYGVNKDYQDSTALDLVAGRLLGEDDPTAIVLNESALRAVGIENSEEAINQDIKVTIPLSKVDADQKQIQDSYTVVGIIRSGSGSEVFMTDDVFTGAGVPAYQQLKIVADNSDNVPDLRTQIESSGFETVSLVDTLDEINRIFKFFNIMLLSFGSIGMIVAVLGMFNTLTISLLERTKEIGLMMALGGRRSDMRKLFIFEAVLISFVGAIVGLIIARIGGLILDFYMNSRAEQRGVSEGFSIFSTPAWVGLAIVAATVIVGLLVVYFPARRAEKINPIDALRRE